MAYRKRIKLGKGLGLNLSGSGASFSVGGRGFGWNFGKRSSFHFGIPGTGLYWKSYAKKNNTSNIHTNIPEPTDINGERPGCLIFTPIGCIPALIVDALLLFILCIYGFWVYGVVHYDVPFVNIVGSIIPILTMMYVIKHRITQLSGTLGNITYVTCIGLTIISLLKMAITDIPYSMPYARAVLLFFILLYGGKYVKNKLEKKYEFNRSKNIAWGLLVFLIPLFTFLIWHYPTPTVYLQCPNYDEPCTLKSDLKTITLSRISVTRNKDIPLADWLQNNQLSINMFDMYDHEGPFFAAKDSIDEPTRLNSLNLHRVYTVSDKKISTYGFANKRDVYASITSNGNTHRRTLSFFSFYPKADTIQKKIESQGITWLDMSGDTLYVAHGRDTFADSTQNHNAYISAVAISDTMAIWTSKPLTCNSSFCIIGSSIVCGYGYDKEPDYLYVINRFSGQRTQTIKLDTAPYFIVHKDNKVYVRTYKSDYVFSIK